MTTKLGVNTGMQGVRHDYVIAVIGCEYTGWAPDYVTVIKGAVCNQQPPMDISVQRMGINAHTPSCQEVKRKEARYIIHTLYKSIPFARQNKEEIVA